MSQTLSQPSPGSSVDLRFRASRGGWNEPTFIALWYGFLLSFIIDPGGGIGLKYLAALLVLGALLLYPHKTVLPISSYSVELGIFVVAPLLSAWLATARGADTNEIFGSASFCLTWLIYPVALGLTRKKLVAIFEHVMIFGALLYLACFVGLLGIIVSGRLELVAQINDLATELRLGYFGIKPDTSVTIGDLPNVYFRWSLLFLPAIMLMVGRNTRGWIIVLAACLVSLSTALIFFAIAGIVGWYLLRSLLSRKTSSVSMIALIVLSIVTAWALGNTQLQELGHILASKFSASSSSTSVKLGHIESILTIVSNDWQVLMFGMGAGTEFYSKGIDAYTVNVEVSHFNLLRQFGLVYSVIFVGYVSYIILRLWQTGAVGQRLATGLALLFVAAGTNPLLMGPVFMIPLIISRAYVRNSWKSIF